MVLVPDLVGRLDGLETLLTLAVHASVDKDFLGDVQDEAIALVHGLDANGNLANAHVAATLDLEQALLHLVLVDVLEARSNTARHVTHTYK